MYDDYRLLPQTLLEILHNSICALLLFFSFLKNYLFYFIYLWLHWVFIAGRRLSLVAVSRGYSSLRCMGFSLWWLLLLRSTGSRRAGFSSCGTWASVVVARGLQSARLSSCGARAQLLHGMWGLPGPGLKPASPALAGGFLTGAPPGKYLLFSKI